MKIDRLMELEKAATPGPWRWEWYRSGLEYAKVMSGDQMVMSDGSACDEYCRDIDPDGPDGKLIVEMRNMLPGLLKLYRAAKISVDLLDACELSPTQPLRDALLALEGET